MEISTEENQNLVSTIYERVMKMAHAERHMTEHESYVFQVELLSQEVNSGASFDNIFAGWGKQK